MNQHRAPGLRGGDPCHLPIGAEIGLTAQIRAKGMKTDMSEETAVQEEVAEVSANGTLTAFEALCLDSVNVLNEYSDAVRDQLDKAVTWDESLFPLMYGIRYTIAELEKQAKGDLLGTSAIKTAKAAVETLGLKVDIAATVGNMLKLRDALQPAEVDTTVKPEFADHCDNLSQTLNNRLIVTQISEAVQTDMSAAIAKYRATMDRLRGWANQSKRNVPSNTGTKGPQPADAAPKETKSDKVVSVTFVSENGTEVYASRGKPQPVDKAAHAIKEKLLSAFNVDAVPALPAWARTAVLDTLVVLADAEIGHQVQVPQIGTFTRK